MTLQSNNLAIKQFSTLILLLDRKKLLLMQNQVALNKAHLLMEQGRFKMAEQELRQILALYRSSAATRAMLSTCLLRQKLISEALHQAKEAIRIEPSNPDNFHVLSLIYLEQERYQKAEKTIRVSLNHYAARPDYLYVLASIFFQQSDWVKALKVCDMALTADAEHIDTLNLRARVLSRIGQYDVAEDTFNLALRSDPENPVTHANKGWAALEQKEYIKAQEHFQTALCFNPELEFARTGLVESIKAKYLLYRWFLNVNYWSNTGGEILKILLVVGMVLCVSHFQYLSPLYLLFVLFMWFPDVIFNAYLQKDERTRQILSSRERKTSRVFATIFSAGILCLGIYYMTSSNIFHSIGVVGLGMLLPLVGTLRTWSDYYTRRIAFTVIAGVLGLVAILSNFFLDNGPQLFEVIFFHAILGYTWYENFNSKENDDD